MAEEYDARVYRLAQLQELLNLFEAAHRGRPAHTVEELEEWVGSPEGQQETSKKHSVEIAILQNSLTPVYNRRLAGSEPCLVKVEITNR
jgi:truncated hemoglobin YjbI